MSRDEASRALAAATGPVHTWLLLGMFAGLRAHEIAKVRGEDVTPDALYVVGKGNKAAVLPMHPLIWEAAQTYPRVGWWFPSSTRAGEHVGSAWVTAATTRLFASLGIEGSIHRCRHYFGTELLRAGASVRVIQTLMRHESLATTANYLGVDEDERTAAVRLLAA